MRAAVLILALGLAVVAAAPKTSEKIVGGSITTIEAYPSATSLLFSWAGVSFSQICGGVMINNRAVLTAAHCFISSSLFQWRMRVGSPNANSGGSEHNTNRIIMHPSYNRFTLDNDIGVMHATTPFIASNRVRPASIAGSNYNLPDNSVVWAVGWGRTSYGGQSSEQLRHVQIWTVNQAVCRTRYAELRYTITDNMLCSGWLDVGGRDQCQGDSGGPLYHNGIVVGICSWGEECALPRYPGVNARVSRYTAWIQSNA